MLESAQALLAEHAALEAQLADPEVVGDQARFRDVSRRYAALGPVVALSLIHISEPTRPY